MVFGKIWTGAADDLKKVHEISRSMVTDYGMGTELHSRQLPAGDYSMSDHTRRLIDEEQQFITDQAYRRAVVIVEDNRDLLEAFAQTLLDREVLERADIDRLMVAYRDGQGTAANGAGGRPQVAASEPPLGQPGVAGD